MSSRGNISNPRVLLFSGEWVIVIVLVLVNEWCDILS
jgi:hypothetical protein